MQIKNNSEAMKLISNKGGLQDELALLRQRGKTIGFVPTMGALHRGHTSLVERAIDENDACMVSIYVNPTQFNDKNDLDNYPRELERDLETLGRYDVDFVFAPGDKDMYPGGFKLKSYDFGQLSRTLEGEHRPGHFDGVATVVDRFLEMIQPDRAYFGEKDYQQLLIVRKLVELQNHKTKIIACPIVREGDGLAMSSRNQLLSPADRKFAAFIYQSLQQAKKLSSKIDVKSLKSWVEEQFRDNPALKLEYFEIVDARNLYPVPSLDEAESIRACVAVWAGHIRLIDNIEISS